MSLRVVQVNCFMPPAGLGPAALLEAWPSLPLAARAAAAAGAEVHVLQASRRAQVHQADGVTYRFVAEPRLRRGAGPGLMPCRMAREVERLRPDAVHFHGLDFPLHLRAVCASAAPVLVQDHAARPRSRWPAVRRWSLEGAAACAFTSTAQAEPFARRGELPPHLQVLEIPECSTVFTPGDQAAARRACGVFGNPAALWVGHLDVNKDPLAILRAVRFALERLPELHLWCAFGKDALLPQCVDMVGRDPLLVRHVHFFGRVPHPRVETLCRACDLFVLGSHREGSGYALLEAMACGLVPVVSDIPSFRALTGDGAIGALAPVGDSERFAAGIVAQSTAPGRTTRAQVLAHFDRHLSPSALGRRLVEAYAQVAGCRPAR